MKRFEHELKKHCKVVPVDEFRTSKLHNQCKCTLSHQYSHVRDRKDKVTIRTQRIHSVLFCKSKSCNGMAMDRDENAARNILEILKAHVKDGTRPLTFCRGTVLPLVDEMCVEAPQGRLRHVRKLRDYYLRVLE